MQRVAATAAAAGAHAVAATAAPVAFATIAFYCIRASWHVPGTKREHRATAPTLPTTIRHGSTVFKQQN